MTDVWISKMFCASMAGSLAALFWPIAIQVWKVEIDKFYSSLNGTKTGGLKGAKADGKNTPPIIVKWIELFVKLILLPFMRKGIKWLRFILLALFIAGIATAAGFIGFLKNQEERKTLVELGNLAFFAAFNYGFMASSIVEDALRKPQ